MMFSIVIPCHNVAAYLEETLKSVLAQTTGGWECICVDDGSTDGTAAVLDSYAVRDARFRVIHKENAGVSAARNDAIAVARGDYVCFLDGDDVWAPDWLQKMSEATLDGRADIVRMQFTFWHDGDRRAHPVCVADNEISIIEGVDEVFSWGWQTYANGGYIWLNAFRREMLIQSGVIFPLRMKINEDIIFDLSLLPFVKCVVQCSYAGYYYRMRSTSAWHSKRPIEGCTRYFAECNHLWQENRVALERLDCIDKIRYKQTFAFWCSIVEWIDLGFDEERRRAGEILRELRVAWKSGMLDIGAVPFYWQPSFWFACRFNIIAPMYMTFRVLRLYHQIRRKLV